MTVSSQTHLADLRNTPFPETAAIRAAYREANGDLLRQRIDLGVGIFALLALSVFLEETTVLAQRAWSLGALLVLQGLLCVVALASVRSLALRERLPRVGACLVSLLLVTVVLQDVLLGMSRQGVAVGVVSILACTAALFPWGWRAQLAVGLAALGSFLLAEWVWFEAPFSLYSLAAILPVAAATVAGALFLDRYRFAAFERAARLEDVSRANREEADIAAALVEVGQTLAMGTGQPDLFDRVNRLVVELLGCDWSVTIVSETEDSISRVVGVHGVSPEVRDVLREMSLDAASLPLLERLEGREMAELDRRGLSQLEPSGLFGRIEAASVLAAPLVLGEKVVGAVANGYLGSGTPFTGRYRRITAGIAQATAIAVENQRLFNDLTRANQVKDEFASTMSHEMRTPLNVILGFSRVLEEGDAGPLSTEQRDIAVRISRSVLRLGELVDDILDLSKLESGAERIKFDWVDIDAFVAELDADFRPECERAGLQLEWHNESLGRRVRTEGPWLRSIVRHLVSNAVKFTAEGFVRVEMAQSGGSLVITVSDSGIGIAPDEVPLIFDEFRQGDSSDSRQFDGAGLGLHIVRRLVERLDGSIAVVSEPGNGSVFTVEIPAQFARARAV